MDELRKADRLLSVNWEDGMLIKAEHFIDEESYFESLCRWLTEHDVQFPGLTGPTGRHNSSLNVRIDHDGQDWVVVVSRCYAITPSGRIVQIDEQLDGIVRTAPIPPGEKPADGLPVYICATSNKVKVGHPSGNGEPTRHPFRAFIYQLFVGALRQADPADCIKIGEINFADNRPALSPDYIPPCMIIRAHPLLAEQCRRLQSLLTFAQQGAVAGFQAFAAASHDKPSKFGVEHKWFQEMCSGLAIQLGGLLRAHPTPEQPVSPLALITYYRQVFGIVEAMMETYREAALTLKKKYSDNDLFKRFIDAQREFVSGGYNHNELSPQISGLVRLMNDFVEFLNLVKALAGALPQRGTVLNYRNREYRLQPFASITSQIERDSVTVKIDGVVGASSRDILLAFNRELFSGVDYRYIMVKIGLNENSIPGRMDPVYVDAEASSGELILKPMDDLASAAISSINLNFRGNFNPQDLKNISIEMINVYIY